ncbi:MAG TPA: hypothetical protein VFY40_21795, partial [Blastocatellia bacterium]|nr:hypothetical protein [Blastocatellia bacterium]
RRLEEFRERQLFEMTDPERSGKLTQKYHTTSIFCSALNRTRWLDCIGDGAKLHSRSRLIANPLQRFSDERRLRSLTVAVPYRARKQAASSIKRKPL